MARDLQFFIMADFAADDLAAQDGQAGQGGQSAQETVQQELVEVEAHHDGSLLQSAEFFVAAGFLIFVGLMLWLGVHKMIAKALDDRSDRIAGQIEEARQLREEAQADLAQRQRRQKEATAEAESILNQAEEDSRLLMDDAVIAMDRMAGRREDMAAQKINQAKLDAIKSLRAEAAHIAVEAARRVMREQLAGKKGSTAMAQSIKSLES
ncbi:hypothetical protein [Iodidimonas sp. MBR-22]|nr:hypothetical protein [Iodidimonas sp. MBR-22]